MARASAGVMSAARAAVSASPAARAATRIVFVFIVVVFRPLINLCLVVLIVPLIVGLTTPSVRSPAPRRHRHNAASGLVVNRTLALYSSRVGFHFTTP